MRQKQTLNLPQSHKASSARASYASSEPFFTRNRFMAMNIILLLVQGDGTMCSRAARLEEWRKLQVVAERLDRFVDREARILGRDLVLAGFKPLWPDLNLKVAGFAFTWHDAEVEDDAMLLRGKSYLYMLASAVIAAVVMMGPAFAEQSSNAKVVSAELRAKCQAQVRTLRIRGGGTSAKKRRLAAVQQCIVRRALS